MKDDASQRGGSTVTGTALSVPVHRGHGHDTSVHDDLVDEPLVSRRVPGNDELTDAVVALLLEPLSGIEGRLAACSWQGYLHGVAHDLRQFALRHPRFFPLVVTHSPGMPRLWPPVRNMTFVGQLLTTLQSYGLSDAQVLLVYRGFVASVLGYLLQEVADPARPDAESTLEGDASAPRRLGPALRRLRSHFEQSSEAEEFEAALEALLDRLEQDLARPSASTVTPSSANAASST